MDQESINKLYNLLEKIPVTQKNEENIKKIKELVENGDFQEALEKIKTLDIKKDYFQNKKKLKKMKKRR